MTELTHFDASGAARMVDVTNKAVTERIAVARCSVVMAKKTLSMVLDGRTRKGDVVAVARLAGIMGAKRTSELIPLCHPLPLDGVEVDIVPGPDHVGLEIEACIRTTGRTGVEMEALLAVSTAALTVYDMVKAVDRAVKITDIRLVLKDGGKSGRFEAV
ncbi:MAG: cyclic pyranopterin monophosphate synthase MoaC [Paracoccaceae bacterium]|nr:cyclic pyranopterin monophosphate synthase MoaC [Paracoccaceae bacterium]MDE2915268.1 cyclic pyranopterin monophosphate synthase MoaC [Paracoccaceae bacterium]